MPLARLHSPDGQHSPTTKLLQRPIGQADVMKFNINDADLRKQFSDGAQMAPHELFAAMLAFSPERVVAVSTRTAEDTREWVLLGVTVRGLAVVTGTARQSEADTSHPRIGGVTATWTPIEAVTKVELQDVRESSEYYNAATEVAVDATWVLEIRGQKPLTMPRDPEDREGAVDELVGTLITKRQRATTG